MSGYDVGILYGALLPKFGKRANVNRLDEILDAWMMEGELRADVEVTTGGAIGVWVALGPEGSGGYPKVRQVELAHIKKSRHYAPAIARARKKWAAFVRFAKKRGATFERPRLYLARGETG